MLNDTLTAQPVYSRANPFPAKMLVNRRLSGPDSEKDTRHIELSLAGITSLADRVAILSKLENDVGHRVRYLDVRSADLVGRPSEDDLATLAVEGMLGLAAAKLSARIEKGGPEAAIAKRALERLFVEYSRGESA